MMSPFDAREARILLESMTDRELPCARPETQEDVIRLAEKWRDELRLSFESKDE